MMKYICRGAIASPEQDTGMSYATMDGAARYFEESTR